MDERPTDLDDVWRDVEERQKSILWEDQFRNNRRTTEFLWHGDPQAKPVQRIGLVVFAIFYVMIALVSFDAWYRSDPDERAPMLLVISGVLLLLAIRFIRNAFLRGPNRPKQDDETDV